MIIKTNTKAGFGQSIDRTGSYFSLISCSAGSVRVKAFNAESIELFNSVVFAGASIDFDFVATKIELQTEVDAEISLFWSKSRFHNPAVAMAGAGIARMKTVAVDGLVRLNTVQGQNKEVILKAKTDSVFLSGQMAAQVGGYELAKGEQLKLNTSGDIYARGQTPITSFAAGSVVEVIANPNAYYFSKLYDKSGLIYGNLAVTGTNGVVGIGHAMHSSWAINSAKLTKWRDRLFTVNYVSNTLAISEIKGEPQTKLYPFKVIKTNLALGPLAPNNAVFSNDGNFLFCAFGNAVGGLEHVIFDLSLGIVVANYKAAPANYPVSDAVAAYNDGWVFAYDKLYFLDTKGQVKPLDTIGYQAVGLNARIMIAGGNIMVNDSQSAAIFVAYDNSLTFERFSVVSSAAALVGDAVLAAVSGGLWIKSRFEVAQTVSLTATYNRSNAADMCVYIAPNGDAKVAWSIDSQAVGNKVIEIPVGMVTGSTLPALVDVVELF